MLPVSTLTSYVQVYHSSFKVDLKSTQQACSCPLLPLKSHIKGPAPTAEPGIILLACLLLTTNLSLNYNIKRRIDYSCSRSLMSNGDAYSIAACTKRWSGTLALNVCDQVARTSSMKLSTTSGPMSSSRSLKWKILQISCLFTWLCISTWPWNGLKHAEQRRMAWRP